MKEETSENRYIKLHISDLKKSQTFIKNYDLAPVLGFRNSFFTFNR